MRDLLTTGNLARGNQPLTAGAPWIVKIELESSRPNEVKDVSR